MCAESRRNLQHYRFKKQKTEFFGEIYNTTEIFFAQQNFAVLAISDKKKEKKF